MSLGSVGAASLAGGQLARLLRSPLLKEAYAKGSMERLTKPGTIKGKAANYLNSGRIAAPILYGENNGN